MRLVAYGLVSVKNAYSSSEATSEITCLGLVKDCVIDRICEGNKEMRNERQIVPVKEYVKVETSERQCH